jgi:hypothetical protein
MAGLSDQAPGRLHAATRMGVLQSGPRPPLVRVLVRFHSHLPNKPKESQLNLNKIKNTT